MLRTILIALALAVAGTTGAAASSWITRDVNLRAGPSTHHRTHGVLRACTRVDVHAWRGGWLQVAAHRGHGWVSARYVSDHRPRGCHSQQARRFAPQVYVVPNVHIWRDDGWHDRRPYHRRRQHNPLQDWNDWHDW